MDSFYNKDTVISQLFLLVPVAPGPRVKAEMRNGYSFSLKKLVKLLDAIGDLPLGNFEDNSIDLFGDAYEYLMQMYASTAGKSGGEFYTPQEVSELLARITVVGKKEVNKVYDPACGSGSLLLSFYFGLAGPAGMA